MDLTFTVFNYKVSKCTFIKNVVHNATHNDTHQILFPKTKNGNEFCTFHNHIIYCNIWSSGCQMKGSNWFKISLWWNIHVYEHETMWSFLEYTLLNVCSYKV